MIQTKSAMQPGPGLSGPPVSTAFTLKATEQIDTGPLLRVVSNTIALLQSNLPGPDKLCL